MAQTSGSGTPATSSRPARARTAFFTQSTGGGGGLVGNPGISFLAFAGTNGDAGDAGKVEVESSGDIFTAGDGTLGIFAQSGSGSEDKVLNDDYAQGATGTGKTVDVTVSGKVISGGLNSRGVLAQSIGMNANSDITVAITPDGHVAGGEDTDTDGDANDRIAAGIELLDGADNMIDNQGTITSTKGYLGTAILGKTTTANSTTIRNTIENKNTLIGSIYLDGAKNTVINHAGGRMIMGSEIDLVAAGKLKNLGLISPGGVGRTYTTRINGDFQQADGATYENDIDFKLAAAPPQPGATDLLHVTGTADLDGNVKVNSINGAYLEPRQSGSALIMTTGRFEGTPNLEANDTAVINYELTYEDAATDNVHLTWTVDYTPPDLNANQTAIGNYLNDVLAAGEPADLTPYLDKIHNAESVAVLQSYYDQLSAEAYVQNEVSTMFNTRDFTDALIDCKSTAFPLNEEHCMWFRASGTNTDRDETFEHFGYDDQSIDVQAGVGTMINDNASIAAAIGYGRTWIDTRNGLSSGTGNRVQGGLSASVMSDGATLSLAAVGGAAFFDSERYINIIGPQTADGDQDIYYGAGQARLQYEARNGRFSAIPAVDAWAGYFHQNGFTETGAGPVNLEVASGSNTYAAVRPGLTLAADLTTEGGTSMRAFLTGAYTYFFAGENPGVTASLQGDDNLAPGFTVTTALSSYYVDTELGLDLLNGDGSIFRMSGMARFGEDYQAYGGDLQFVKPF